jgi:hypothetical protein
VTVDLRERFERRVDERAVAEVLGWIASARRLKPIAGDLPGAFSFWFDGGAGRVQTGHIEYEFANGARATVGDPVPSLTVAIEFANGCRVRIEQQS